MKNIVAIFAGDSGDGVQLLGNLFTDNVAMQHYDLNTFPDYPAEIRAPAGTIHGVSGFQIKWGNEKIMTSGDVCDVLVVFNAAAFKKYKNHLKPSGILIYDEDGFDAKNCKLAQFDIEDLNQYDRRKLVVNFSKLAIEGLSTYDISIKEKNQNKNIFALGFLSFAIDHNLESTTSLLQTKFKKKPEVLATLETSLVQGFNYADTIEFSLGQMDSKEAPLFKAGSYRNIQGNQAIAYALLAAPYVFNRNVFFGGYPITPASDILHELSKYSLKEIKVVQAEDEIAAISMAIGAAYGGTIGVTASSGPGIDLKQEAVALAMSAEIPVLIIDVQRAGPSTGMPTKIEQSDLEIALYGRHGESPIPIVAIKSPSTAFDTTLKAIEIMIEFQTPVFLLSDVMIANGSEPWYIPTLTKKELKTLGLKPFERDENQVRPWTALGVEGSQFIVGGLEKNYNTGQISYDPANHQKMTHTRLEKVNHIAPNIPTLSIEEHSSADGTLIISWGSTFGSVEEMLQDVRISHPKLKLAHIHLEWIVPLPTNFNELIAPFDTIIVAELNMGQLANYLRTKIERPILQINKVEGIPFYVIELREKLLDLISNPTCQLQENR